MGISMIVSSSLLSFSSMVGTLDDPERLNSSNSVSLLFFRLSADLRFAFLTGSGRGGLSTTI